MNATSFPDLQAVLWVGDRANMVLPPISTVSSSLSACRGVSSWPPILAQNRDFSAGNLFVLVPDFSFFTLFWRKHDHGSVADVWFDVLEAETDEGKRTLYRGGGNSETIDTIDTSNDNNSNTKLTPFMSTPFSPKPFEHKRAGAIFRGKVATRAFGDLRGSLTDAQGCVDGARLNTTATTRNFVSRRAMCSDYQAIVTVPGNGVWSWASKYNMVSDSELLLQLQV